MSIQQDLSIQVDLDQSMEYQDSIPSPPSNTWLAILPSQDLIPSNVVGANLSLPVSQIYSTNQSREFKNQNFSYSQVEIFANQTKEICLHLQKIIEDKQQVEQKLSIENQSLKDNITRFEAELRAEKVKYNQIVHEGKTRISCLSSDNIVTKENLDMLKKNYNDKQSVIDDLTDQIDNLSLESSFEKTEISKRAAEWQTRYNIENVKWTNEKQSFLTEIESLKRSNFMLDASSKDLQDKLNLNQNEKDNLSLQVTNLQSKIDKKTLLSRTIIICCLQKKNLCKAKNNFSKTISKKHKTKFLI